MLSSFLIIFLLFVCFDRGHCGDCVPSEQPKTAEGAIREKIFCNYNKKNRPVKSPNNQTVVQLEIYPLKISMDDYAEKVTVVGNVQYLWTDNFLQWEPKEYENITYITVSTDDLWMPGLTIDVPADNQKLQSGAIDCLVSYLGKIVCFPVHTISAYCTPDFMRYPYDKQSCVLYFMAQSYIGSQVDLKIFREGISLSMYRPNKAWEIVDVSLKREVTVGLNSTFYPYLKCIIVLQRHSAAHQAIIVLPGLVIAGLTLLTFFMGDMHSNRVTVSGLAFLSNIMYCLYLGHKLPSNGDRAPLVVTFFRDSLIISGVALTTTTLVHHLQNIASPPSNWLSGFIGKLGVSPFSKVFFKESYSGDDDAAEIIQDAKKKPTVWLQLASVIDRLLFFICLFIYIVLFLFFLA